MSLLGKTHIRLQSNFILLNSFIYIKIEEKNPDIQYGGEGRMRSSR